MLCTKCNLRIGKIEIQRNEEGQTVNYILCDQCAKTFENYDLESSFSDNDFSIFNLGTYKNSSKVTDELAVELDSPISNITIRLLAILVEVDMIPSSFIIFK